jgi:hypothetical protein
LAKKRGFSEKLIKKPSKSPPAEIPGGSPKNTKAISSINGTAFVKN